MKVLWLHNYNSRNRGMFMWDIFDRLCAARSGLGHHALPVVRRVADAAAFWSGARGAGGDHDLVHAQYGSIVGLAARLTGRPYLVSFRGSDIYPHPGTFHERLLGRVRLLFSWLAARRARAIIVMSEAMRDRLRRWPGIGGRPIHILVDPCGTEFWASEDRDLAAAIRTTPLVVSIASLLERNPVKRVEIVGEAVELCRAAGMNITLKQIVGRPREEVRAALDESDVLALASTHEGWPNVIKEALLRGKRFVATDVSDLADFALARPHNKIVAPDAVAFAFAFVDIATEIASASANHDEILAPFHPDACVLKHLILYGAYGTAR